MANDFFDDLGWDDEQVGIYQSLSYGTAAESDQMLMTAIHFAYFDDTVNPDDRHVVREWIDEYVEEEYGFDFDEYFDWEAWREWYNED